MPRSVLQTITIAVIKLKKMPRTNQSKALRPVDLAHQALKKAKKNTANALRLNSSSNFSVS
ncbi:hypothetical protein [Pseudoalteromonas sp. ECSMB14103]|uniref:hypothetical protein n=1 Tax=Pseudoalteromonas sp. ECSMB14103 TaxID=1580062 RepID=UPI001362DCE7|nr:hypothetical protein [Pseudoalteromonas sp. ECSMB14103]